MKNTLLYLFLTQGHFGETWGLYEQKSDNQFISCAYDNHVKMWDASQHKAVWDIELEVSCVILSCKMLQFIIMRPLPLLDQCTVNDDEGHYVATILWFWIMELIYERIEILKFQRFYVDHRAGIYHIYT